MHGVRDTNNSDLLAELLPELDQKEVCRLSTDPVLSAALKDTRSAWSQLQRQDLTDTDRRDWEETLKELLTELRRGVSRLRT